MFLFYMFLLDCAKYFRLESRESELTPEQQEDFSDMHTELSERKSRLFDMREQLPREDNGYG